MPQNTDQGQPIDLDRTDRLPVLTHVVIDDSLDDDAVPLAHPAPASTVTTHLASSSCIDLPLLAEAVRTVEERMARQTSDYQALSQAYERALDTEAAVVSRANAFAADILALRAQLADEQTRVDDLAQAIAERNAALEAAHARIEDAAREAQRRDGEMRNLRDTLLSRDETIVQLLQSLADRDAELTAVRSENSTVVPALEAQSRRSQQLETDLQSALATVDALKLELTRGEEAATAMAAESQGLHAALDAATIQLDLIKSQSASYLERLQTRAWRSGFDHNLFREMDAALGAMQSDAGVLNSELDVLNRKIADLSRDLAEREQANGQLQELVAAHAEDRQEGERVRAELTARIMAAEAEERRQAGLLCLRDAQMEESRAAAGAELQRVAGALEASERHNAEQAAQVLGLQAELGTAQQEMGVLIAHLHEARRPIGEFEAELRRLTDELTNTTARLEAVGAENRELKDSLEHARGALEEREFLIRRLERSESINANALARIQTTVERLAAPPAATSTEEPHTLVPSAEISAWLERIDRPEANTYVLGRRTRIGRASGSDLQLDSNSASRNHAVILVGPQGAIIEDVKSTNGVVVNGSRVRRQFLRDGDIVSLGETTFRYRTH